MVKVSYRYDNAQPENIDYTNPNTVTVRIDGIEYEHVTCHSLNTDIDNESYVIADIPQPTLTPGTSNSCRVFFATGDTEVSYWDSTAKEFGDSYSKCSDLSGLQFPIVDVDTIVDENGVVLAVLGIVSVIDQPYVNSDGDKIDSSTTFWPMLFVKAETYELNDAGARVNPSTPDTVRFGLYDLSFDNVAEVSTQDHSAKRNIHWNESSLPDFEWLIMDAIRVKTDQYLIDLSEQPDPDQVVANMYNDMLDMEKGCMALGDYDIHPVQCAQPALNECNPFGGPPSCPYDPTVAAWEDTSGVHEVWRAKCCPDPADPTALQGERICTPTNLYELIYFGATGPFKYDMIAGSSSMITTIPSTLTKQRRLWAIGHYEAGSYMFKGASYRVDQANGTTIVYKFYRDPNHVTASCNVYAIDRGGPVPAYAKLHIGGSVYGSDLYLTDVTGGYATYYFRPPCPVLPITNPVQNTCAWDVTIKGKVTLTEGSIQNNMLSCNGCFEYIGLFSLLFDSETKSEKHTSDSSEPGPTWPPNVVDEAEVVTDKHTVTSEVIVDFYNDVVERDKVCFNKAYHISGLCSNFLDEHLYPTHEPIHNWNADLRDKPIPRNGYQGHVDYRAPFDNKEEVFVKQIALVYVPYDKYLRSVP